MGEKKEKAKGLLSAVFLKIKKDKRLEYGLYALIIILVLALYLGGTAKKEEPVGETGAAATQSSLETRLAATLSAIKGAGKVEVFISYDTTAEKIPALATDQKTGGDSGSLSSEPVTMRESNGGDALVVLMEIEPQIRGVVVVAQGAREIGVRLDLERAVRTALGIQSGQVEVFAMNEE